MRSIISLPVSMMLAVLLALFVTTACDTIVGSQPFGEVDLPVVPSGDDSSGDSGESDDGDDEPPFDENDPFAVPPDHVHGAPTIWAEVNPKKVTVTNADGSTTIHTSFSISATAFAMNMARPGDVIVLRNKGTASNPDVFPGVEIGKWNPGKANAVFWTTEPYLEIDFVNPPPQIPVSEITIVGEDASNPPVLEGIAFLGDIYNGSGGKDIYFKDLIIRNEAFSEGGSAKSAFSTSYGGYFGLIGLYNITFQPPAYCTGALPHPSCPDWGGYGMMWNVRAHGPATWDVRGVNCAAAQEHCLYLDSPNWDGDSNSRSVFLDINQDAGPSVRTMIQIVNRKNENPCGQGSLIFKDLSSWVEGLDGSHFTVAGHPGPVLFENTYSQSSINPSALVFWTVVSDGVCTTPDGFSTEKAEIRNMVIDMPGVTSPRAHMKIAGVGEVAIYDFLTIGLQTSVALFDNFGGPIDNGLVQFFLPGPVSAYSGFQAGNKVTYPGGNVLSDAEIDAMQTD